MYTNIQNFLKWYLTDNMDGEDDTFSGSEFHTYYVPILYTGGKETPWGIHTKINVRV